MTWSDSDVEDSRDARDPEELFPRKKPTWGFIDGLALIGVYILTNIIMVLVGALVSGKNSTLFFAFPLAGAPLLTLLLAYVAIRVRTPSEVSVASLLGFRIPGIRKALSAIPLAICGGFGLIGVMLAQNALLQLIGLDPQSIPEQPVTELLRKDPSMELAVTMTFFAVVVAPFTEEILFRSALYVPLRSKTGPIVACFVCSAIFAVVHWYVWGMLYLFAVGLLLVALAETSRSLLPSIAVHALHNGVVIAAIFAGLN